MSLVIVKGKDLISPEKFRAKILLFALPGFGKTEFLGTACPGIGIAACETGQGNGLLTIADRDPDCVFPESVAELKLLPEVIAAGRLFADKGAVGLDSLSYMAHSFIKKEALRIKRTKGVDSGKRAAGVPELDDYGTMGNLTRDILDPILRLDKHVLVTATLKIKEPKEDEPGGILLIGPDLPGAMFTGSAAMFDVVMCGRSRTYLKDPKDAKSRVTDRYWLTYGDANYLVKCRCNSNGVPLLEKEEPYDPINGVGTFPTLLKKIVDRYAEGVEG